MSGAPSSRADRLAGLVAERGLDAVLVGDLVRPGDSWRDAMADLTWLTGFTGTSGLAIVGPGVRTFITDFRYIELAGSQIPGDFEIVDAKAKLLTAVGGRLGGRIGFDEEKTSVKSLAELAEESGEGVELVAVTEQIADLRRVKDEVEIIAIAEAARLTDMVYAWIEEQGLAGRTEREIALGAEARMRELGASGPSFPSIVAAGPNGALPHAVPSGREIGRGEYVVVDMGAIVDGYCSDGTRTLCDGNPDPAQREVYELVLQAQVAALEAIRAGASGLEIDAVARRIIGEGGHGEHFGHGLGHGVGIEVHEGPRLSKRSPDELRAGDVVTVEPGVYLPGEFGIRIEDLVVVTEDGIRNLSTHPK